MLLVVNLVDIGQDQDLMIRIEELLRIDLTEEIVDPLVEREKIIIETDTKEKRRLKAVVLRFSQNLLRT